MFFLTKDFELKINADSGIRAQESIIMHTQIIDHKIHCIIMVKMSDYYNTIKINRV